MCGIIGYIANNKNVINDEGRDVIRELFVRMQSRGDEATGIVTYSKGLAPVLARAPVNASSFVQSAMFNDILSRPFDILIGHTRKSTGGSPINNANNHPHFRQENYIVHNGWVGPSKEYVDERNSLCDSEHIANIIESKGVLQAFEDMDDWTGSYAVLNLNTKENALYVFRYNQPIAYYENNNVLPGIYLASTFSDVRAAVDDVCNISDATKDTEMIKENALFKITQEDISELKDRPKTYGTNYNRNWNKDIADVRDTYKEPKEVVDNVVHPAHPAWGSGFQG